MYLDLIISEARSNKNHGTKGNGRLEGFRRLQSNEGSPARILLAPIHLNHNSLQFLLSEKLSELVRRCPHFRLVGDVRD